MKRSTARWQTVVMMVAFAALIVLPPPARAEETISVASWNVRNISTGSRTDAELGIISLVIFRYDFIALQEVLDERVVARVQEILKNDFQVHYDFVVSPPIGHNKKERYAFLWRTDKIAPIGPPRVYPDPGDRFEREPYCGTFKAGMFDWTMCTIHVLFGDSEAERRPELLLLDDVYRFERDAGDEPDVFICGDFNFDPYDPGWSELKAEDGMAFAISPPAKTTIEDVSLYDNCWWPQAAGEVVGGSGSVYEFDELMYPPGSRKEANRLTSDHRPISVYVRIDGPDDD